MEMQDIKKRWDPQVYCHHWKLEVRNEKSKLRDNESQSFQLNNESLSVQMLGKMDLFKKDLRLT